MRRDPFGNELLKRMYFKHGAYWHVRRNRWQKIGSTYNAALRGYAGLQDRDGTMPKLINQTYDAYSARVKAGSLRQSSMNSYNVVKPKLMEVFAMIDPPDVTPAHIRQFIGHCYTGRLGTGNRALSVLREAFDIGIEQGLCDFNPASQVKRKKQPKRTRRLTDAEFKGIRQCAKGDMPLIMDVLYYTGQRIGDVLAIKQSDISGGVLHVTQQKTGAQIAIDIGPLLEQAISAARSGQVTGLWLFSKHGKPYSYFTVQSQYKSACKRAGIDGTTLHDIRAKTITDMTIRGDNAQSLAGHSDAKMTADYVRETVATKVKSLDSLRQSEK
jgi:integrase